MFERWHRTACFVWSMLSAFSQPRSSTLVYRSSDGQAFFATLVQGRTAFGLPQPALASLLEHLPVVSAKSTTLCWLGCCLFFLFFNPSCGPTPFCPSGSGRRARLWSPQFSGERRCRLHGAAGNGKDGAGLQRLARCCGRYAIIATRHCFRRCDSNVQRSGRGACSGVGWEGRCLSRGRSQLCSGVTMMLTADRGPCRRCNRGSRAPALMQARPAWKPCARPLPPERRPFSHCRWRWETPLRSWTPAVRRSCHVCVVAHIAQAAGALVLLLSPQFSSVDGRRVCGS